MNATTPKDAGEAFRAHGANGFGSHFRNNQRPFDPVDRKNQDEIELPPIKSGRVLREQNFVLPKVVVHGLLHEGSKMVLGGGSKSFKTWCLGDLALSVVSGVPWWGIPTNKGGVLYINFEIQEGFFFQRLDSMATAKGLGVEAVDQVDTWNLRGHCADLSKMMKKMLKEIKKGKYSLIILDPIYKGLGGKDENSAGEIGKLLNEVERLAVETGAAVVFGAHFSKGNQAGRESIDRISGSGVFARDPDTIVTMTKHDNEYTYTVDATLRNFAPMEPFCVKWEHPLMARDDDADPNKLKVPGKKTATYTVQQLLEVLADQELFTMEWYRATAHRYSMSKRTFMDKLAQIKNDKSMLIQTAEEKWKAVHPTKTKKGDGAEVQ